MKNKKTKAFLYSIRENNFRVDEGFVYSILHQHFGDYINSFSVKNLNLSTVNETVIDYTDAFIYPTINEIFIDVPGIDGPIVWEAPGVLYNSVVWFEERNDEKAFDILLKQELKAATHHSNKMKYHLNRIEILEKGLKEEF